MNKITLSVGLLILAHTAAKAQGTPTEPKKKLGGVQEHIIDIKPKIQDAEKIDAAPVVEAVEMPAPDIKYDTRSVSIPTPPYKGKLEAPRIKIPEEQLNHNYVKLGIGNYSDVYAEGFYNTLRNRTNLLSVQLKHHSGNGPSIDKNSPSSRFSETLAGLYAKKLMRQYVLDGNLRYQYNANRYYAQPEGFSYSTNKDSLKQRFNTLGAGIGFSNAGAPDSAFRFSSGLEFVHFSDHYKASENIFSVMASGEEPFSLGKLHFDGGFDYLGYTNVKGPYNRNILRINANYRFNYSGFKLLAGFKTANETDSAGGGFRFFPDIKAGYDILKDKFSVEAGLTGDLHRVTFQSLAMENPFIRSDVALKNTRRTLDLFGGIKAALGKKSALQAGAAYRNFEGMYFYANDSVDVRRFVPLYDNGVVSQVNVHAELGYAWSESFNIGTRLDYYKWSTAKVAQPWQREPFKWTATTRYNLDNKILFGGELYVLGARKATVLGTNKEYTLKPIIDLNANVTYSLKKKGVKLFLDFNNILAQKYQVYNFYNYRGFQVRGGVILNFL